MARQAPAVRFFAEAMANPNIVKGALCHGLWILTPRPDLLSGRRVICHEVMIADVVNAGAIYVAPAPAGAPATAEQPASGVVVDRDLVTGNSYHVAVDAPHPYIEAIKDAILAIEANAAKPHISPSRPMGRITPAQGKKRVLVVLSEYGYWGEELVGPVDVFDATGYAVEFATPRGRRPKALPPSADPNYFDPALGRPVTTPEVARRVLDLDGSSRLDNPHDLSRLLPERPYVSQAALVHALEAYYRQREVAWSALLDRFDALLLVGGSGPCVDMVNNGRVHDLVLGFAAAEKPIAAECYAIGCLAFAREAGDRRSILLGKRVTGHCLEYDYKRDWGFFGFEMGAPPYPLEYILRDAVGPKGEFIGNYGRATLTIVDYPFLTGRSTSDGYPAGEKLVEMLEHGLRRFGW